MALYDNAILPLYRPGAELTARASAAIGAGKFVVPTGAFEGGPALDISTPTSPLTGGNNFRVALAGAGVKAIGVTAWDTAADGDKVTIFAGGHVVPMTAGANITSGAEVESNASGNPIALASGRANGICISTATSGNTAWIKLY